MRLIVLNGPPASGKSTLARRYLDDNQMALCLDLDQIRGSIGHWASYPTESGLQARAIALAMARVHLEAGHDVIVPQLLALPTFPEQLRTLAVEVGAEYDEVLLSVSVEVGRRRLASRVGHVVDPASLPPYDELHAAFEVAVAHRSLRRVDTCGDVEAAYALLRQSLL